MYLCQHNTIKSIYHQIIKCEEVSELPLLNNTKKPIFISHEEKIT